MAKSDYVMSLTQNEHFEEIRILLDDTIVRGELRQIRSTDPFAVRMIRDGKRGAWNKLDTRYYDEAKMLAMNFLHQNRQHDDITKDQQMRRVIEDIASAPPHLVTKIREAVNNRVTGICTFQTHLLFTEHKLNSVERSLVGLMLMRRELEGLQAQVKAAEENHELLQQRHYTEMVREQKCAAVCEQVFNLKKCK
jgi:hypothetical protein